jgi:hypothetical protein
MLRVGLPRGKEMPMEEKGKDTAGKVYVPKEG